MKQIIVSISIFIIVISLVSLSSITYGATARSAPAKTDVALGTSPATQTQVLKLVGLAILGTLVLLIIMGLTNRVVIFYDQADAWWSVSPFLFLVASVIITHILTPDGQQFGGTPVEKGALVVGAIGALVGIYMTIYNAIRYNRNIVFGLFVGICKVIISLAMALTVMGSLNAIVDKKTSLRGTILITIFLSILGFLWKALINGERVYNKKGWATT